MLVLLVLVTAAIPLYGDNVVEPTFHPQLAGNSVSEACTSFSIGNWDRREFSSPGYPGDYPNKTECKHLIIAPKGYRIRLDFRDDFKVESSADCKYDYVEFRDGPFGYSPLLGRFCGERHPTMRESSTRFMWVHFVSDDSIEYKGFRAVYDFFKSGSTGDTNISEDTSEEVWDFTIDDTEVCRIVVDVSKHEGVISQNDIPEAMSISGRTVDCTWAFYLPDDHMVRLVFEHLQTTMEKCDKSFLEIYEQTTSVTDRQRDQKLCGTVPPFYKTKSNHLFIRIYSEYADVIPELAASFTVFVDGPCDDGMFECGDSTCINKSLECNGNDNCNYKWDEEFCETSTVVAPTRAPVVIEYHTVIIGIVGGAIVTIIFLSVVITCYQKRKEDARQHHALCQEERHAMEVEMTNLLNRSPQPAGGMNAVHAHPNGPVNHVSASRPPVANHVTPGHPPLHAHTQAVTGKQNGHTREEYPSASRGSADADVPDFSDINGGGGNFRRYLDVHAPNAPNDEDSSPNPSTHNQIPTVATIEKQPSRMYPRNEMKDISSSLGQRERTPSPRPDVVQEPKFMYPEMRNKQQLTSPAQSRRLSDETVRSEKSDVWKPMTSTDISKMPSYRKPHMTGPAGAQGAPVPPEEPVWAAPQEHPADTRQDRGRIGFEPISDSLYSKSMPKQSQRPPDYGSVVPVKTKVLPPAPPQRRTTSLPHQMSAPEPPTAEDVPLPEYRATYSRTPPSKPRVSQNKSPGPYPSKQRSQEKPPSIFYTRPNQGRSDRNIQRQHHPV